MRFDVPHHVANAPHDDCIFQRLTHRLRAAFAIEQDPVVLDNLAQLVIRPLVLKAHSECAGAVDSVFKGAQDVAVELP